MNRNFTQQLLLICFLSITLPVNGNPQEQTKTDSIQSIYHPSNQDTLGLPTLSARYEIRSASQNHEWFIDRKMNVISTFNGDNQRGEIWTRDHRGDVEYTRVFMEDKMLVEYTTGELKTQNKLPDWNQLSSIFDPKVIESLKISGEKMHFGEKVLVLEGKINNVQTTIWWIPKLKIPSYVLQKQGNVDTSMTLKEIYNQTPITWKWLDTATYDSFSRIDASDVGDMESDPFVKKLLEIDGHVH
jgi:hypothetical protein